MTEQMANFGHTTLNGAINDTTTSVVVTDGSVFPSSGDYRVRVDDEIMLVTARSTNTLTVTRGAESTTAASHSSGADIDARLTAGGLLAMIQENSASGLVLIEDTIMGSDATTLSFTGIPQTFKHLLLVCRFRTDRATGDFDSVKMVMGGTGGYDTGNNYDWFAERTGTGGSTSQNSTATSGIQTGDSSSQWSTATPADTSGYAFIPVTIEIADYRDATWRTVVGQGGGWGNTSYEVGHFMGRWKNTTADNLDRIQFSPVQGTNLVAGTRVTIYGIADGQTVDSVPTGTSFPGTPNTGDRYRRSDLDYEIYFYNGTYWLTEQLYTQEFQKSYESSDSVTAGSGNWGRRLISYSDYFVESLDLVVYVANTNNGSNYWTYNFAKVDATNDSTNVTVGTITTSAGGTASNWNQYTASVNAYVDASAYPISRITYSVTGSPGTSFPHIRVYWRKIAT